MPEGPSIVLLKEALQPFARRRILEVSGNSKAGISILKGQKLLVIRSWGKHLLLCFEQFYVRIHLLMFGSFRINERKVSEPRLRLRFSNGEFSLYACSVRIVEEDVNANYDWSSDTMSDEWDHKSALSKMKKRKDEQICDVLLDQDVFAGVGNIIKCEVLHLCQVHPEARVRELPLKKLEELATVARAYCFDFYRWKKAFELRKHWRVYRQKSCPRCGGKIVIKYSGKTNRRTFFCAECQYQRKAQFIKSKSNQIKDQGGKNGTF